MLDKLIEWDERLFLHLNAYGIDWLDPIMFAITGTAIWIPMYLFIIYLTFKAYGKASIWILVGIGLAILLADQGTSGLMKPYFGRLRPCHDTRWEGQILNYRYCGGLYGFASSHASNAFAVATYFCLVFYKKIRGFGWLFLWAAIFSYTRIYLGVHYPGDVLIGALVGILSALIGFYLAIYLKNKINPKLYPN
ncbi:phosphatase PAP2 family protein [Anditalea andensis]|uniref:Phospholipid phosphatase n=1 Tax=Anditalea andensis TaxID=1048983 RepID=A0A074LFK2_9BACT|nr:phosphatase PAP2 family protein [Anditalea andensis]KEO72552.1 phospholipid phosphatase [Anditalea andensis]